MNTITGVSREMERVESVESGVSRCISAAEIFEPQDCAGPAPEAVSNQREEQTADEAPRWWGINE